MGRRKESSSLGQFHKDAMAAGGLTYAEAQIQETCRMAGKVRVPQGKPGGTVYSKVSTRGIMKRLEGQQAGKAKDRVQLYEKVHELYTDKQYANLLKALRRLQNDQVTREKYLYGNREFKKRVEYE